ncbi:MAG: pentaheme c-type cytochrome TorC [Rhodobacteraceae bacterium]|nr:pentaheme c-type cytochrome TorC [Paracoccaceae bacterium]
MRRLWNWFWSPAKRWSLGALLIVGGVGGVLFWGSFNWAMEASNTMEFCISCHEMESTVYQEYRETVHFQNASGVRAICSDCHVPHDWAHKVVRKVYATRELFHHFAGTIDTPEKFEAHRAEMAQRVWATMQATDSRECRNCHAFESMAFHLQSDEASEQMQAGWAEGQTCIDCHKGIAHRMPDLSQGYKAMYVDLQAEAASLRPRPGETYVSIAEKPLYMTAAEVAEGGRGAGTLLSASTVEVVATEGDAVQIRIAGWQQEGAERVIYALQGRRIFTAALRPEAAEGATVLETMTDPDTEQVWKRPEIEFWTAEGGMVPDIEPVWAYGAEMFNASCSVCHSLHDPQEHLANQWIGLIKGMERFITLDKEQTRFLQKYVQFHARDVVGAGAEDG